MVGERLWLMGMPVLPADFQQTIVTPTGSVCDRLKALFSIAEKLYAAWVWLFDSSGNATQDFKNLFLSIGVPIGAPIPWVLDEIPEGFLVANGQEVSKTTYAALYARYGDRFGTASNSSNFKVPDMRGYAFVGVDGATFPSVGAKVGATQITQTVAQMPAHSHSLKWRANTSGPGHDNVTGTPQPATTTAFNTESTGGGQPMSVVQPSFCGHWIIKT